VPKLIRENRIPASFLFGLAPCVVCPARCIAAAAVRSYRTFSPLPPSVRMRAVYFLWHFPSNGLEPGLPDVIRHTALRSSDFPLPASEDVGSDRPVQLPTRSLYGKIGLRASTFWPCPLQPTHPDACYNARDAKHKSVPSTACDEKEKDSFAPHPNAEISVKRMDTLRVRFARESALRAEVLARVRLNVTFRSEDNPTPCL
jgi:hypothetical protein